MPLSGAAASEVPIPKRLPILPLLSSVLFPAGVISLQVGISRNIALLKTLDEDQDIIGLFCQKGGTRRTPGRRTSRRSA